MSLNIWSNKPMKIHSHEFMCLLEWGRIQSLVIYAMQRILLIYLFSLKRLFILSFTLSRSSSLF